MAYRFTEAAFPFTTAASVAVDAAGVRTAVGLASANLDTQLTALSGYVDCLPVTLDGSTFTALPAVALTAAYDAAKTAAQASTALSNLTWTDAKAAYINAAIDSRQATVANLTNAVTMAAQFATMITLDGAVYDFTAAALAAAPTGGSAPTVEQIRAEMDANSTKLANLDSTVSSRLATVGYTAPLDATATQAAAAAALTAYDPPTNAELEARSLIAASYATSAQQTTDAAILAKLDDTLEDDGGTYRFTENSLEQAPSGVSTGATAEEVWEYATRTITNANGTAIEYTTDGTVYCARADIEDIFGPDNVAKWADRNNNGDADEISNRIAKAITVATNEANDIMRGGPYPVPITDAGAAASIVPHAAALAGAILYEWCGIEDYDADTGRPIHKLEAHRKRAEKFFESVRTGRLRLDAATGRRSARSPFTRQ